MLTNILFAGIQKKKRRRRLWSNGVVSRKKSSHTPSKETNGAESGEEEDDEEENEDCGKVADGDGAEEKAKDVESEPMEVENMPTEDKNTPLLAQNGHVSGEGDCSPVEKIQTENYLDCLPNGCSVEDRDKCEVQLVERTDPKRVEHNLEEDTGIGLYITELIHIVSKHTSKLGY